MDKTEISTGEPNNGRQPKGLRDNGTVNLECSSCGHPLLVLQLTSVENDNQTEVLTRVAVRCGFCGGYSRVQQISGQFYPGTSSDNMGFDVVDDNADAPEADVIFEVWGK